MPSEDIIIEVLETTHLFHFIALKGVDTQYFAAEPGHDVDKHAADAASAHDAHRFAVHVKAGQPCVQFRHH